MNRPQKVEITHKTIIFTVFFLIGLFILFQIRAILLFLFIAVILMSALTPPVDWLEKHRLPRGLAIIGIYVIIWAFISFSVASLVPVLVEQSTSFIRHLPQTVDHLTGGRYDISLFNSQLASLPQSLLKVAVGAVSNVVGLFTLMVIVYYLILERKNLHRYLMFLFGNDGREQKAEMFINRLEKKLGGWVRGQLLLMLFIGVITYLGLIFLGIDYAVPLAFLAGVLEMVPNIGPTLAAVPAVLIAYGSSPILAVAVTALYVLIQQAESTFIVPRVMSKAVGLSPLVVIVSLLIGFKLAGVAGAVLALPSVLMAEIIFADIKKR